MSSSKPTISILPADAADLPELATIQRHAFASSPIDTVIFGNVLPADADAQAIYRMEGAIGPKRGRKRLVKAVEAESGRIVGLGLWTVAGKEGDLEREEAEKEKEKEEGVPPRKKFPKGTNMEIAEEFLGAPSEPIDVPHYYLSILVVHPEAQGKGVGSAILAWGAQAADEEGVESYLKSTPVGMSVYKKAGYRLYTEPHVGGPNKELILYPMRRLPPLKISLCTTSDAASVASIHYSAFKPLTIFQNLFPTVKEEEFVSLSTFRMTNVINTRNKCIFKAERGGKFVGFAYWQKYIEAERGMPEEDQGEQRGFAEGTNVELAKDFFERVDSAGKAVVGDRWELHVLATAPEAKRTGVGKELIEWGMQKGREEGVPVYLDATDDGIPLYQKMGFVRRDVPAISAKDASFSVYPMVYNFSGSDKGSFSPFTVRAGKVDDIPTLASIYHEAFCDKSIARSIFPNVTPEDNQKRMGNNLRGAFENSDIVRVCLEGDVVVGFSWYEFRDRGESENGMQALPVWPEGTNKALLDEWERRTLISDAEVKGMHCEIHYLVTSPSFQRRGIGQLLLEEIIADATERNLRVVLNSTVEGREIYAKHGFVRRREDIVCSDNSCTLYPMVLDPTASQMSTKPSSAPSPLSISLAGVTDADNIAKVHVSAFSASAMHRALYPYATLKDRSYHASHRFAKAMNDPYKAIYRAEVDGKLVGMAYYSLPMLEGQGEELHEPEQRGWPAGTDVEAAEDFFTRVDGVVRHTEPHYELHAIAVDANARGSGAGRALVQWGMERARQEQVPLYLDSAQEADSFYLRMGFTECGDKLWDRSQTFYLTPLVWRPPPPPVPPLQILPAEVADSVRMGRIHAKSFAPVAIFRNLFPRVSEDDAAAGSAARFSQGMTTPGKGCWKAVRGEEILGFAYGNVPQADGSGEAQPETRTWKNGTNIELATDFFRQIAAGSKQIEGLHYEVHILATDPSFQKTGAGSALLKYLMSRCEAERVKLYLNATDEGLGLYKKLGFRSRPGSLVAKDGSFSLYPMVWTPSSLTVA